MKGETGERFSSMGLTRSTTTLFLSESSKRGMIRGLLNSQAEEMHTPNTGQRTNSHLGASLEEKVILGIRANTHTHIVYRICQNKIQVVPGDF